MHAHVQVTGVLFLDNNLDDEMAIPMLVPPAIPTTAERSISPRLCRAGVPL